MLGHSKYAVAGLAMAAAISTMDAALDASDLGRSRTKGRFTPSPRTLSPGKSDSLKRMLASAKRR